mgnify:CR=1 FL=1
METEKTHTTGLFFGSFNPVHIGHLAIANYMIEFTDIHELWFVVSPHNPLKKEKGLIESSHRLTMLKIAIQGKEKYKVSDYELKLPRPSYTYHTLKKMTDDFPERKFILIIGADNIDVFDSWKNYREIMEQYQIYVYPRKDSKNSEFYNHRNIKEIDAPLIEISSTFIRNNMIKNKDLSFFTNPGVFQYINSRKLYQSG